MKPSDVTYVIQGPLFSTTYELIEKIRHLSPDSSIIFSTWAGQDLSRISEKVEGNLRIRLLISDCPPALNSGEEKWFSNINRMIASTAVGLQAVTTPYAMKLRSDTVIDEARMKNYKALPVFKPEESSHSPHDQFANTYINATRDLDPNSSNPHPIVMCWSLSHHPFFLYYISDWFHFGRTLDLRRLWAAPLATKEDAEYFLKRPQGVRNFSLLGQYRSTKFHARYHSEQYLCLNYFRKLGESFEFENRNDCSLCKLVMSYASLTRWFRVVDRARIPFTLPTHPARNRIGSLSLFKAVQRCESRIGRFIILFSAYIIYWGITLARRSSRQ